MFAFNTLGGKFESVQLSDSIDNEAKEVLTRIVDVTLTLASSNSAFRAGCEKLEEINNRTFLSVIELLGRYDPVLQRLITSKSKILEPKNSKRNDLYYGTKGSRRNSKRNP